MASADRNLKRNKTLDSYLRYRKQLYGSKEKETLGEDILGGTTNAFFVGVSGGCLSN